MPKQTKSKPVPKTPYSSENYVTQLLEQKNLFIQQKDEVIRLQGELAKAELIVADKKATIVTLAKSGTELSQTLTFVRQLLQAKTQEQVKYVDLMPRMTTAHNALVTQFNILLAENTKMQSELVKLEAMVKYQPGGEGAKIAEKCFKESVRIQGAGDIAIKQFKEAVQKTGYIGKLYMSIPNSMDLSAITQSPPATV